MPISRRPKPAQVRPYAPAGIPGFPAPHWAAPGAALYLGDVRACLRALPARSVHCVVTSPPYWGLRDYSICSCRQDRVQHATSTLDGSQAGTPEHFGAPDPACQKCAGTGHVAGMEEQIGTEPRADCLGWATGAPCGACYVCHVVDVFREMYRVLREDGTVWLNLGDTYSGGGGAPAAWNTPLEQTKKRALAPALPKRLVEVPSGNLVGVPWRVALALQADGWTLLSALPWVKSNAMPESTDSRPGKAVEDVFLLAKGTDHFFDMEAVKRPAANTGGGSSFGKQRHSVAGTGSQSRTYDRPEYLTRNFRSCDLYYLSLGFDVPAGKYHGAHFATFPPDLIRPMILASTSEFGCCARCGAPYDRVVMKDHAVFHGGTKGTPPGQSPQSDVRKQVDEYRDHSMRRNRNGIASTFDTDHGLVPSETLGWRRSCGCRTDKSALCVVLDPFVGSGTTVATALELGRSGVGIDLSEEYLREHAVPRIEAAIRGEKVPRNNIERVVPPDVLPIPTKLR